VVKASTGHYVFPAIYYNLKRANFLHYLPEDLVFYMKHITDLNRDRNQQIIEQAKEINTLLLNNNITPIFLKGTGNILEDLYEDIGERMVGDIDFIVSKEDFKNTIEILKKEKYNTNNEVHLDFHWHYPRLVKENRIAAVEVHKKVLKNPYSNILSFKMINENTLTFNKIKVASYENQILNSILPKQINDNLYHSKIIQLRTVLDIYLINKNLNGYFPKTNIKKIDTRLNNFIACSSFIFGNKKSFNFEETISSRKYLTSYKLLLENSKKEKIKTSICNNYIIIRDQFKILQYSFTDKDYRNYSIKRLKNINFYLKKLGLKKPKSNS
jgi:hypothetical protein